MSYKINPIGYVKSPIQSRHDAPKQESENAPQAVLEILPEFAPAMDGLKQGQTIRLVTWFDRAYRGTLECHQGKFGRPHAWGIFHPLTGPAQPRGPAQGKNSRDK